MGSDAAAQPPAAAPQAAAEDFVMVGNDVPVASAPPAPEGGVAAVQPAAQAGGEATLAVTCTAEYQQMSVEESRMLSMVEVKAPPSDALAASRAPVEICAVIDRSGSMRVKKLALVLESLKFVTREMSPQDKLSIVTYDHRVSRAMPTTSMTAENKKKTLDVLKTIKAGGSTNLSDGLLAGLKEVRRHASPPQVNGKTVSKSVWLFTDGQATDGIRDTEGILEAVNNYLGESTEMTIFTFGFGDSHNEQMLRAVAEAGSGMYYYLQNPAEIPACFAECLGGLLTTVASDISVKFTPFAGVEVVKVPEDGAVPLDNVEIKYKNLYGDECRNILLELKLQRKDVANTQVLGCAKVTWRALSGEVREVEAALSVDRVAEVPADRVQDGEVKVHRMRLDAADAMVRARVLADAGNLSGANELMKEARVATNSFALECEEEVLSAPVGAKNKKKKKAAIMNQMCDDFVELEAKMQTKSDWNAGGRRMMANAEMGHRQQRAAKGKCNAAYGSNLQSRMMKKAMNAEE